MQASDIGVYIICFNEENYIRKALDSVRDCGQVAVVDSGSTDGTLKIIRQCINEGYPVELIEHEWCGYAAQKQFALEQLRTPWALNLDADEYLEPGCLESLMATIEKNPQAGGIKIRRKISLPWKGVCDYVFHEKTMRCFKREGARYEPQTIVHERVLVNGPIINSPPPGLVDMKTLSFRDYIKKNVDYAYLKANMLYNRGVRPRPLRLLFSPTLYFWRKYLFQRYFLAGLSGFIHAFSGGFVYVAATEVALMELHWKNRLNAS